MIGIVAPIAVTAVACGLVANLVQNRPAITTSALSPQWNRIDPRQRLQASLRRAGGLRGRDGREDVLVAVAAFVAIWPRMHDLGELAGAPPGEIMSQMAGAVMMLALYVCVAFLIGIVDFTWKPTEKSLKMTRRRCAGVARVRPGSRVRGAIRRRQFARARQRMIADVATADVVTNPTHFAVALRYDGSRPHRRWSPRASTWSPRPSARPPRTRRAGAANPPLARALHKEVEIGQIVPDSSSPPSPRCSPSSTAPPGAAGGRRDRGPPADAQVGARERR